MPAKPRKQPAIATPTTAIRVALERLIFDVLPAGTTALQVGKAATFYAIDGDTRSVCGIKIRKGEVGLHLPAVGTYDDPQQRLVGKGPAGRTLWIASVAEVRTARRFVEAALAFARS